MSCLLISGVRWCLLGTAGSDWNCWASWRSENMYLRVLLYLAQQRVLSLWGCFFLCVPKSKVILRAR